MMLEYIRQQHKKNHAFHIIPLYPLSMYHLKPSPHAEARRILPWIPKALRNIFRGIISDRSCCIKCIE